jgi:nitrous-oxide reductase
MKLIGIKTLTMATVAAFFVTLVGCGGNGNGTNPSTSSAITGNVAEKAYVKPGEYDEFYAFISGGFSGQLSVYGLPSGRLLKVIPVFSQDAEKAYGYNEETKPLLNTTYGMIPWDDAHHPELSQTNGETDGRWCFINGNNTPRVARVDLTRISLEHCHSLVLAKKATWTSHSRF